MKIRKIYFLIPLVLVAAGALFFYLESLPVEQFVTNQTFVKYSDSFFSYEATKYPSNVKIVSPNYEQRNMTLGLVTDPWNINFGIIPLGGYGTRHLAISNSEKNKVKIDFKVYGDISSIVRFSKNSFILKPNESVYIDIVLNTSLLNKEGNYSGEIDVVVKKPNFDFLYSFL